MGCFILFRKTKKRKRANFSVEEKTEDAIIARLERIHKGDKIEAIHEVVWGESKEVKLTKHKKFTGRIKFYDDIKGFGFIQPDEDREDLFFHGSALVGETVYDDDLVEFETIQPG